MPRFVRFALLGALLFTTACQVQTDVTMTMDADGSGTVEVVIGLDADAVAQVADVDALFETDDLVDAGWSVSDPDLGDDDVTRIGVSRAFGSPAEAEALLEQVGGESGLFEALSITRTDSFTTTTYEFTATADLSDGLAAFSDSDLAAALDGEPLGESVEAIEQRFGAPIDELFVVSIHADLPGDLVFPDSHGPVWQPRPGGDPVSVRATSEIVDRTPLMWLGVGLVLAAAAVGFGGRRLVQRRRFRRARSGSPSA